MGMPIFFVSGSTARSVTSALIADGTERVCWPSRSGVRVVAV
jgi:hypothetical protein